MQNNPDLAVLRDEQLVVDAQQGSNPAFAELIQRHRSTSLKLAMSVLRDFSDAEDEVQNATWKAFEHIGTFNQDAKFSTWFSRIVLNQCLMRLRKQRRARLFYLEDARGADEAVRLELPDIAATPEDEVGSTQVAAILRQEVRRMPPLLREVFVLRELEQRPMPNVAETLGISIPAAKSRLLRARLELKRKLERHCGRQGAATLTA